MRKAWIAIVAAALVILSVSVVQARVDQYRALRLNRQNLGRIFEASTSNQSFEPLPGWGFSDGPGISVRGGFAVTVSITIEGGPVDFRVLTEAEDHGFKVHPMKPTSAHFDPGAGSQSFSFTFVAAGSGHYTVNLYWRSPTGVEVTETGGAVVIQYATAG
jgi:hypothetical protein